VLCVRCASCVQANLMVEYGYAEARELLQEQLDAANTKVVSRTGTEQRRAACAPRDAFVANVPYGVHHPCRPRRSRACCVH